MVEPWQCRSTHTIQETCWWKVGTLGGNCHHKINSSKTTLLIYPQVPKCAPPTVCQLLRADSLKSSLTFLSDIIYPICQKISKALPSKCIWKVMPSHHLDLCCLVQLNVVGSPALLQKPPSLPSGICLPIPPSAISHRPRGA